MQGGRRSLGLYKEMKMEQDKPKYTIPDDETRYTIPEEALEDEVFARMIKEAEKYLGYPYVWGGSSPSTSFDCSGFVCWVINNCGNGWNVGRKTAEELRQMLPAIPSSEAKPGDLIFFKETYKKVGATHVGIYVGEGMMIHCGSPLKYSSVNTDFFRSHYMCYCRLSRGERSLDVQDTVH